MINISDLDKAEVLCALYNQARPLGMGFLHYIPGDLSLEEARKLLTQQTYFDYLKGRVMKVDLRSGALDVRLYERDNGPFSALHALEELLTRP